MQLREVQPARTPTPSSRQTRSLKTPFLLAALFATVKAMAAYGVHTSRRLFQFLFVWMGLCALLWQSSAAQASIPPSDRPQVRAREALASLSEEIDRNAIATDAALTDEESGDHLVCEIDNRGPSRWFLLLLVRPDGQEDNDLIPPYLRNEKTYLPPKNRVWGFLVPVRCRIWKTASQVAEPHQENAPTPTILVSGVRYFGARYYDPALARFLSSDPYFGDTNVPPSLNKYLYAYANPYMFVDLEGYWSWGAFGKGVAQGVKYVAIGVGGTIVVVAVLPEAIAAGVLTAAAVGGAAVLGLETGQVMTGQALGVNKGRVVVREMTDDERSARAGGAAAGCAAFGVGAKLASRGGAKGSGPDVPVEPPAGRPGPQPRANQGTAGEPPVSRGQLEVVTKDGAVGQPASSNATHGDVDFASSGETPSTRIGKSAHQEQADLRRASGEWHGVNETIKTQQGEPILVPKKVNLQTGEPAEGTGTQQAKPDAVNYNRKVLVDDKPEGRNIMKDRQEMIRNIKAYEAREGELPQTIGIQRYDPQTGQPVRTDLYEPEDFLPGD